MYILRPIDTTQQISFLTRDTIVYTAEACFRDDQTNEEVCLRLPSLVWGTNDDNWEEADYDWESIVGVSTPTETNDFNVLTIEFEYNPSFLKEGHFYDLEVKNVDDGEVYFKDRIFVTAQEIDQSENKYYKISKNDYVEPTTDNEDYNNRNDYIVL